MLVWLPDNYLLRINCVVLISVYWYEPKDID